MSDRDPQIARNPAMTRLAMAKAARKGWLAMIEGKTSDLAEAPLPLHKSVYIDEERFEAERKHLFLGQPVVACLSGDIRNPGDYVVFDAAGPSILVTRDKSGSARAFLNMCTHRGAKLIEASEPFSGHAPRMVCPFHGWTFDAGGKLVGQPHKAGFEGCEIGARNLLELPCAEHLGLVFVRAGGGEPIDAAAHLGALSPVLEALEIDRAEPVKKGILTADSNWKFALDTYGEGYHFQVLHASTIGQTSHSDIVIFEPKDHRVGFPPFAADELLNQPESEWPEPDYGGVHYIFPNTVLFFGSVLPGRFFTQVFRLFPDGVGKTRCQFAVYAPFGVEDEAHKAMCEMAYDATATVVQTEDYRVASTGYANLMTAPEDFHVVLGRQELALHTVHRHIADAIGMPL
jgi:carnitine monooxygenase subunit